LKIIYDHKIFTLQKYGGISRYFCELAKRLIAFDTVDTSIIAPLYVNKFLTKLEAENIVGRHISWDFPGLTRVLMAANRMISPSLVKNIMPELVHETYYSENCYKPLYSKSVITVFDMIHEKFGENSRILDNISRLKKEAVQRSDHIICISENTKRDLIDIFDVDPNKITVTYLASSLSKNTHASRIIDEPYILYVGSRSGYKNFQCLLSAYISSSRLAADFKLVCFGGGAFTKNERLFQQQMNIPDDRLIQLGGNDDLLVSLYMHAAVFVYPSLYEGFGIPPLEAMKCGCPVVCSNTGSLPEVVGSAAKTFDPYQGEDIRQSIEDIVYHYRKAESLVMAGRERANLFSWDKCAQDTLDVYKKMLG